MYSNGGRFICLENEEGKLIKEQAPVTVIFTHAVKCGQALMFICICFLRFHVFFIIMIFCFDPNKNVAVFLVTLSSDAMQLPLFC